MAGPRAALLCKPCGSLRMGLEPSFDGELRRRDGAELPTGVREVRITRLQSRGPFFDIDGVGFFGDPTLTAIRQSGPRNTRVRSPLNSLPSTNFNRNPQTRFGVRNSYRSSRGTLARRRSAECGCTIAALKGYGFYRGTLGGAEGGS